MTNENTFNDCAADNDLFDYCGLQADLLDDGRWDDPNPTGFYNGMNEWVSFDDADYLALADHPDSIACDDCDDAPF